MSDLPALYSHSLTPVLFAVRLPSLSTHGDLSRCDAGDMTRRNGTRDLEAGWPVFKLCWDMLRSDPERLVLFLYVSFDEYSAAFELTTPEFEVADTLAQSPLPRLGI